MGLLRKPEFVSSDQSDPKDFLECYTREGIVLKATIDSGYPGNGPYQWANIEYRMVDPNEVKPTATYVLRKNLEKINELNIILKKNGYNIFDLAGILRIGKDEYIGPPFLEVWNEHPYDGIPVVVDGAHRLWEARKKKGTKVGCIVISGYIHHMLPVFPLDGWNDVKEVDSVPEVKRRYAEVPAPYKPSDLYRVGFPGSTGLRPIGSRGNQK